MMPKNDIFGICRALVAMTAAALCLNSCFTVHDYPMHAGASQEYVTNDYVELAFTIECPELPSHTKTGLDDGRSVAYENYVDPHLLKVLFFGVGADRDFKFQLDLSSVKALEPIVPKSKRWLVTGILKKDTANDMIENHVTSFRVMLLANYAGEDDFEGSTIDGVVESAAFELPVVDSEHKPVLPSADSPIPMFGIKQFDEVLFRDNLVTYLGNMHLLRAMSKIEVNAPASVELVSVALYNYNEKALAAPRGIYGEDGYVVEDGDEIPDMGISLFGSSNANNASADTHSPALFAKMSEDGAETDTYAIYVPEYRNVADDGTTLDPKLSSIMLTFSDGARIPLDFRYYDRPDSPENYFNLQRSYYYKYSVTRSEIMVEVEPYDVVELEPEYGQDLPMIGFSHQVVHMFNGSVDDELVAKVQFYVPEAGEEITFSSSDEAIATVELVSRSADGLEATARVLAHAKYGRAEIYARIGSLAATCTVLNDTPRIVLDKNWIDLAVADSTNLTASVCAERSAGGDYVTWPTPEPGSPAVMNLYDGHGTLIAQAEKDADNPNKVKIKGIAPGETDIEATYMIPGPNNTSEQIRSICHIVVGYPEIRFDSPDFVAPLGFEKQMLATVWPNTYYTSLMIWTSTDPSIVEITKDGVMKAKAVGGPVTIYVDCGKIRSSCTVTVMNETITLSETTLKVKVGTNQAKQIAATVYPAGNVHELVWTSSNAAVATVLNGAITGVAAGTTTITVSLRDNPSVRATCAVTVVTGDTNQ